LRDASYLRLGARLDGGDALPA